MEIELEIAHRDEVCTAAAWRSLIVLSWQRAPTAATANALGVALAPVARRAPHGVVLAAMIGAGAGVPDSAARAAVQRSVAQLEPQMVAALNAVLGSGFQAAAIRAVVTGLTYVARPKFPSLVVGNLRDAAVFIVQQWPARDQPVPAVAALEPALARLAPR